MYLQAFSEDPLAPVVIREVAAITSAEEVGGDRIDVGVWANADLGEASRMLAYLQLSVDEAAHLHGVLGRALRELEVSA